MPIKSTKVYIFPVPGREGELQKIKERLEALGCDVLCWGEAVELSPQCIAAADVLVILICDETLTDQTTARAVELASRLGKRIVGVWAADADSDNLPPCLNQHGDANVRPEAEELSAAICDGDPVWVTPNGEPRPKPRTPRHKKR